MTELRMACPETWEAKKLCAAWGAPGAHGCGHDPGHSGPCKCPCGKVRLSTSLDAEYCGCCGAPPHRGSDWCAPCRSYGHLAPMVKGRDLWDRTWFARFGEPCPNEVKP